MIELFKKNDISTVLLLLPYAVVVRIYSLLYPSLYEPQPGDGIIIEQIFGQLVPSAIWQSVIAILLIYVQGNMINMLVNQSRLLGQQSALSGLFYVLCSSFIIDFQSLTPVLIGMTFFLLALFNVFAIYKKNNVTGNIFNAAFLISLASWCYFPFILMAVPVFIEITVLKSFKLVERLQYIVGLVVVYWILGSLLFYIGRVNGIPYSNIFPGGAIAGFDTMGVDEIITLAGIGLIILWSLINYYNFMKKKGIGIRKKIDFFYWYLAGTLLCFLLLREPNANLIFLLVVPACLFLAMKFMNFRNLSFAELLHILFLVALFYIHFGGALIDQF